MNFRCHSEGGGLAAPTAESNSSKLLISSQKYISQKSTQYKDTHKGDVK